MKLTMTTLLLFFCFKAYCVEKITISKQIQINLNQQAVFSFVSNPLNDHLWRSEVNEIEVINDLGGEGRIFREDAFIGLKPHFITETELTQLVSPEVAVFTTTRNNPFFLRSSRLVSVINKKVYLKYIVEFDKRMIKEVFGVRVYEDLVKKAYGANMLKYLYTLKYILENKEENI